MSSSKRVDAVARALCRAYMASELGKPETELPPHLGTEPAWREWMDEAIAAILAYESVEPSPAAVANAKAALSALPADLLAERRALERALEPFAAMARHHNSRAKPKDDDEVLCSYKSVGSDAALTVGDCRRALDALTAARATKHADVLKSVHGEGDCHICGKPKASAGSNYCSYPHGRVPEKAVDPEHPEGFWTWKEPAK